MPAQWQERCTGGWNVLCPLGLPGRSTSRAVHLQGKICSVLVDIALGPWNSVLVTKLILVFVLVPMIELALLIELGRHVGTLTTLGLIVITGAVGAALARRQGLGVWRQVQSEMASGHIPAGSIVDGLIILLAGALLITPGVLTDAFGFLCLVPGSRAIIKKLIWRQLKRAFREGKVHVAVRSNAWSGGSSSGPIHDVCPDPNPPESVPGPRTKV